MTYELPAIQDRDERFDWLAGPVPKPISNRDATVARKRAIRFMERKLTQTQRLFVMHWIQDQDLVQAAYNSGLCYQSTSADQTLRIATRLYNQPFIQLAISLILNYRVESCKFVLDRDKYLFRMDEIAMSNMADYLDEDGMLDLTDPHNPDRRHLFGAIREYTQEDIEGRRTGTRQKIKLYDAMAACKAILDYFESGKGSPSGTKEFGSTEQGAPAPVVFNIVPVPKNEFIPAPDRALTTIEHAD